MTSTSPDSGPGSRAIGTRQPVRRRRRPSPPTCLTRPLRLAWQRLAYRLHGDRYGHTPLTDPANVQFVVVEDGQ